MDLLYRTRGRILALLVVATALIASPLACGPAGEPPREARAGTPEPTRTETGPATRPQPTPAARPAAPRGSPNVILVLADDLDHAVFEGSTLDSAWRPRGVTFENALATTSLCCPSRASILRGQYAHNTGLVNNLNEEPGGGARFFRESGLERRTLATLLREGGYETWFGGKYLNGYEEAGGAAGRVPPGWDHWRAYLSTLAANRDGTVEQIDDHYTDWLSGEATRFIEGGGGDRRPFFMQVSAWDTHAPHKIPARHRGAYRDAQAPRPPSFDEAIVSDKPSWVRKKDELEEHEIARFDRQHGARLRSALTLEDLSRDIFSALSRTGQLDETYVVFTSDNGFHMGLHRVRGAKWTSYMEAHEVPFVVSGPGVPEKRSFDHLVANTDLAPTVLDLAGRPAPRWMDGRSFVPFLDGTPPGNWRSSLLIEGVRGTYYERPGYAGVRRKDDVYVEHSGGEREYYDLVRDPYQILNRPDAAPQSLREDLEALRNCAGEACRRADR